MGILSDLTGTVVMQYKADTAQARAEIAKLSGEQKKAAEEAVKAQEKVNKSLDDWRGKAAMAAGAIGAAIAIAKVGFDEYSETVKLKSAAAAINLNAIKAAAGGLKSEMDLLRLSASGAQGAFNLTTEQMVKVVYGMRALEKQGFSTSDVFAKIEKAIREGAVDQLGEFGIAINKTGDRTKDLAAFMGALDERVRQVGGNFAQEGDGIKKTMVQWEDALHKVKAAIGELVVALTPLLEGLSMTVGYVASIAEAANEASSGWLAKGVKYTLPGVGQFLAMRDGYNALSADEVDVASYVREAQAAAGRAQRRQIGSAYGTAIGEGTGAAAAGMGATMLARYGKPARRRRGGGGGGGADPEEFASGWDEASVDVQNALDMLTESLEWASKKIVSDQSERGETEGDRQRAKSRSNRNVADEAQRKFDALRAEMAQASTQAEVSGLTQIFGPLKEFDKYAEAFGMLQSAVTSAFDAWVSGSASAAEAFRMAIADGIAAIGKDMLVRSLQEGAWAIADLARGNIPGAAAHGKAAAAYAAGAVFAGTVAKQLGGDGPGAAGGGVSPGGYRASGGGSVSSGPTERVVIIGDVASDSSNRRKGREFRRMSELAEKYARPTGSYHG